MQKKDKEKKVAIIILTRNQKKILRDCLESIINVQKYKKSKVYVLDNGGEGNLKKEFEKDFPKFKFVMNYKNLGYSKGNNIGINMSLKEFNPDYVLILNDDTKIIKKDWLKKMVESGENDKKAGILCPRIIYPNGDLQFIAQNGKVDYFIKTGVKKASKDIYKNQIVKEVLGACFLVKREVINKIGIFDEKFSPFYGEESDWCERAKKAGYHNLYVGETEIIHLRNQTISDFSKEYLLFIQKRNSIRLGLLNYNLLKILKHTFVHFGSIFFRSRSVVSKKDKKVSAPKKLSILIKAYIYNIKNIKEISSKRKERNNWLKNEKT